MGNIFDKFKNLVADSGEKDGNQKKSVFGSAVGKTEGNASNNGANATAEKPAEFTFGDGYETHAEYVDASGFTEDDAHDYIVNLLTKSSDK